MTALVGPLDDEVKERLVAEHEFARAVDATHPFATQATTSIDALAQAHALPLLRQVREDDSEGPFTLVGNVQAASEAVAARPGNPDALTWRFGK